MPEHRVVVGSAFCPQDVAALQYCAPRLAVDCLTQALPGPPHTALILDVACGTGLVAAEVSPPRPPTLPSAPTCSKFLLPQPQIPTLLLRLTVSRHWDHIHGGAHCPPRGVGTHLGGGRWEL